MQIKRLTWCALVVLVMVAARGQEKYDTLPEVVVTATGTQHRLKDVPVQTEVVTRRELQQ